MKTVFLGDMKMNTVVSNTSNAALSQAAYNPCFLTFQASLCQWCAKAIGQGAHGSRMVLLHALILTEALRASGIAAEPTVVFWPSFYGNLGIGTESEVLDALIGLANAGLVAVSMVRLDDQAHVNGRTQIIVSIPSATKQGQHPAPTASA